MEAWLIAMVIGVGYTCKGMELRTAGIVVNGQMGINETGKVFRVYQGPELYQVPLPSPYTISIIELKLRLVVRSRGYLSYSAIILWISAVYITCQAASLQCMIKTSTLTGCFILSRFGYRFIEDPVRFRFPVDVSR